MSWETGIRSRPIAVAELGPGDSLGVGLAALICGAEIYYGLDVYRFADPELTLEMFEGILELFQRKEPIPDQEEFPTLAPHLNSYSFPRFLMDDFHSQNLLDRTRIARLRSALGDFSRPDCPVRYIVPWNDSSSIPAGSVDTLLSQAVLELVPDPQRVYRNMYAWLKPGGVMSHQLDFGDPRTSVRWNGNWAHSDFVWSCLGGRRAYWGNREPHSAHIRLLKATGFDLLCELKQKDYSGIGRRGLTFRFQNLSDDDLTTRGTFIVARKPSL